MNIKDLQNKKIALLGLGVNNQGMADYFKVNDIPFEVLEWDNPRELIEPVKNYDIVFRSPGLSLNSAAIKSAKDSGVEVYSQTKLFFDLCPVQIIGVTGTKGKGTTATLIYKILKASGKDVHLAGNIGQDPFSFISDLKSDSLVVLELSSFQLQDLHKSPHVSVVLNITSEHLDHHIDVNEYRDAKKSIIVHQKQDDFAILNYDYEFVRSFVDITSAQIFWNSTVQEVKPGSYIKDRQVFLSASDDVHKIMDVEDVGLIGFFNLENITAAIAACSSVGVHDAGLLKKVISSFKGLPHRLEFVREVGGVLFYNDSFSTIPETAIAAISVFDSPIILIAGGSEKGSDYTDLGKQIAKREIKTLVPVGITGKQIANAAKKQGYTGRILDREFQNMEDIVKAVSEIASTGDIVVLSPASASFDMFENYKQRGEKFKRAVSSL